MNLPRFAAILVAILPCVALARTVPAPGRADPRMRTVTYDPGQVVRLSTVTATALVVTFAPDERISAVAVTDSKNLTAMPRDNYLFLKSRDVLAAQPIMVLTKGIHGTRRYVFEIEAVSPTRQAAEQRAVYYSVEFRYPADRTAALRAVRWRHAQAGRIVAARAALIQARDKLDHAAETPQQPGPAAAVNWRYVAQGAKSLLPDTVYDNGNSTFFHFPGNTRIPALFRIDPDGREAAANPTVKGGWLVAGSVAAGWRVRDGRVSLSISNRAYDPGGRSTGTGTISRDVRRVVRSEPR